MSKRDLDKEAARFLTQLGSKLKLISQKPGGSDDAVSMAFEMSKSDVDQLEKHAKKMNVSTDALVNVALALFGRNDGNMPIHGNLITALVNVGLSIPQLRALGVVRGIDVN